MKDLYPLKKMYQCCCGSLEYHQLPRVCSLYSGVSSIPGVRTGYWIAFCFILISGQLNANTDPVKGYIVTKDNKFLSGYIGEIYHSPRASVVTFINELGTRYHLEAELIKGFVCRNQESTEAYKSQLIGRRWYFLKVIVKSEGITLYQAPLETSYHHLQSGLMKSKSRATTRFWLERSDEEPVRLSRLGYKKKLRALIVKQAPELADKIGKKGYRFRDIPRIIEAYGQILKEKKRPRT